MYFSAYVLIVRMLNFYVIKHNVYKHKNHDRINIRIDLKNKKGCGCDKAVCRSGT